MLFTTPTQFAALAVCLIAGWLFGLASHPGGKRAKAKLYALETEHANYKQDADVRVKKAEERAKVAEAERDRADRDRVERERVEQDRVERDRAEQDRLERDRAARVDPVATQPRTVDTDRPGAQSEARPMDRF